MMNMNYSFNYTDETVKTLEGLGWQVNREAVESIVMTSLKRKSYLWSLFAVHPNWDERGFITTPFMEARPFDHDAVSDFCAEVEGWVDYNSALWLINQLGVGKRLDQCSDLCERLNRRNSNYRLRPEMKLSKAISRVARVEGWDKKVPDFERKFTRLSDAINPMKRERIMVISVNPCDYITMSNGDTWKSCHRTPFDDPGCYCAGTLSYLEDRDSFVVYTLPADTDLERDIWNVPKCTRQVFGFNGQVLIQSRLYPQANDIFGKDLYVQYEKEIQNVILECLKEDGVSFKKLDKECIEPLVYQERGAFNYPDWDEYNPGSENCSISTCSEEITSQVNLGVVPHCIMTGREIEDSDSLYYIRFSDSANRNLDFGFLTN